MGTKKKGSRSKKATGTSDKKIKELEKEFDLAGQGLLQSQTDLKKVPWQLTWAKLETIEQHQGRTVDLLEQILKELKKKNKK